MSWSGGKRHLKHFNSLEEGKDAFKSLWLRVYGDHLPTMKDAIKYTGADASSTWHKNVLSTYAKL